MFRIYNKNTPGSCSPREVCGSLVTMEINLPRKSAVHNTAAFMPKDFPVLPENFGYSNEHRALKMLSTGTGLPDTGASPLWLFIYACPCSRKVPRHPGCTCISRACCAVSHAAGRMGLKARPFIHSFTHVFVSWLLTGPSLCLFPTLQVVYW